MDEKEQESEMPPRSEGVSIDVFGPLPEPAKKALLPLLQSLNPVMYGFPTPHLKSVVVVPLSDMVSTVNTMVNELEDREGTYKGSPFAESGGKALPCVVDGQLVCFVIIASEKITGLTPERFRDRDTVSTVLEELLHVWQYGQRWQYRGGLNLTNRDDPCEDDLFLILDIVFDEYIVNRHKVSLLSIYPLVDGPNGVETVSIFYGGRVNDVLRRGEHEIRQCVFDVVDGRQSVEVGWPLLCEWLHRGILDPLARNAVTLDSYQGNIPEEIADQFEPNTAFFQRVISHFWPTIHRQM